MSLAAMRSATRPTRPSARDRGGVGACVSRRAAATCFGAPRRTSASRTPARRARGSRDWTSPPAAFTGASPVPSPVEESPWALEAEDLWLTHGERGAPGSVDALRGVTIRVPRDMMFMLLGPNGCGKSTLLRSFAGLNRPWAGRLRVQAPRAFVFQNPDHQVIMPTVGADVAFGLGNRGDLSDDDIARRVRDALQAVNLGDPAMLERQVSTLSGGQKQRVAIAGALVENPEVLLLDELTTFLDEADQAGVVRAVRKAVDETGAAAVWVTHRLEELEHCDMAAYMEDGVITQVGSGDFIRGYIRQQQRAYNAKR